MSSNLRWRKREAWGVRGSLFILKQYCYKILTKTTTIIECENRAHPTRITLLLEMLDLQGLPVPPTLNLPKRLSLCPRPYQKGENHMVKKITPVLFVKEIEPVLPFLLDKLGFHITIQFPKDHNLYFPLPQT